MMKLGCLSLSLRDQGVDDFIATVSDLGLDMIELHTSVLASTEPDYLREVKWKCLRAGLPIGYLGISNNFGVPAEQIPEQIALIKQGIDTAAFLGTPLVRIFAAYVPQDCTDEEALWPPMIAGMQEVAEYG